MLQQRLVVLAQRGRAEHVVLREQHAGVERTLPRRAQGVGLRSEVNSELNFPTNFEGLVLGCIDADFIK